MLNWEFKKGNLHLHSIFLSQTVMLYVHDGSSSENFVLQNTFQLFFGTVSPAAMIKQPFPNSCSSTDKQFIKNKNASTVIWEMRWGDILFFPLWRVLCSYLWCGCTINKYRRHKIIQVQGKEGFDEVWNILSSLTCVAPCKCRSDMPSCGQIDMPSCICRGFLMFSKGRKCNTRMKAELLPK